MKFEHIKPLVPSSPHGEWVRIPHTPFVDRKGPRVIAEEKHVFVPRCAHPSASIRLQSLSGVEVDEGVAVFHVSCVYTVGRQVLRCDDEGFAAMREAYGLGALAEFIPPTAMKSRHLFASCPDLLSVEIDP